MKNAEGKEFIQSTSGFIVEILPTGARRLNLKEIEEAKIPDEVMMDKKKFNKAYLNELLALKMVYERTKAIEKQKEEEKKKSIGFDTSVDPQGNPIPNPEVAPSDQ